MKKLPTVNLGWWKPTQKEWAPILLKDHAVPWRQESDPTTGRPWASLSPKYREQKQKRYAGQPVLRATGKMQDSAKIVPKGDGFDVKTTQYGRYHQSGTSKMPARPWVGIPDKSLKQIAAIAWKHILSKSK
jgi:phage gpG-like protein